LQNENGLVYGHIAREKKRKKKKNQFKQKQKKKNDKLRHNTTPTQQTIPNTERKIQVEKERKERRVPKEEEKSQETVGRSAFFCCE